MSILQRLGWKKTVVKAFGKYFFLQWSVEWIPNVIDLVSVPSAPPPRDSQISLRFALSWLDFQNFIASPYGTVQ